MQGVVCMKDNFGREIDYIRISVTDRCNLRCRYCMPPEGIFTIPMPEILTYEEIAGVCRAAVDLGIKKVRLTGGEPLVRQNLPDLVSMIRRIPGIESISMTTNGILLKEHLAELTKGGLDGVNISLDTLNPEVFRYITGYDRLEAVMEGLYAALEAGLRVKVNAVLLPREFYLSEENNWMSMLSLAEKLPVDLRFIELMPIGEGRQLYGPDKDIRRPGRGGSGVGYADGEEILNVLQQRYPDLCEDGTVHGNGPAVYYRIPGFAGSIGLIRAMHGRFCQSCNRIRVSSTGKVKPCLCYAEGYDIRQALRHGTEREVKEVLERSVLAKPSGHCFEDPQHVSEEQRMVSIGG